MKKNICLFATILTLYSCSTMNKISGKEYIYESPNRKLTLFFENDSVCTLKNIFYCDDMDIKYREITSKAIYKKKTDMILLKNIICENSSCEFSPIVDIPIQESSKCVFLNRESRTSKKGFDGRTYQNEYLKYGAVPNIDNDTLYIYKKQLTLIKKIERGSIGFIFK